MKYIFITGENASSLGKGIYAASLSRLFIQRGFKVENQKFDPYFDVDPETMSPYQQGEVFVTEDGAETDSDLGYYERFTDIDLLAVNSISCSKIYSKELLKERNNFNKIAPQVIAEIKKYVYLAENKNLDISILEIGGAIKDKECEPFLDAISQIAKEKGKDNVIYIHFPSIDDNQNSIFKLQSKGIQPDILIYQDNQDDIKDKLSLSYNVKKECIFDDINFLTIYELPLILDKKGLVTQALNELSLNDDKNPNIDEWKVLVDKIKASNLEVNIALVGKYVSLHDAYLSIEESLFHAATYFGYKCNITWIDSEEVLEENSNELLKGYDGIIVPGGFGKQGVQGMINTFKYARENNIPILGVCLGMQVMSIEFMRNVLGYKDANSTEFEPSTSTPIIDLSPEQDNIDRKGASMRLGSYTCILKKDSIAYKCYQSESIKERHRHRYAFNNAYTSLFESHGMNISGINQKHQLVEVLEIPTLDFYVGCQYHPEFKSRLNRPHPLFIGLLKASITRKKTLK